MDNIFMKYLKEAEGDETPEDTSDTNTTEMSNDDISGPPDMPENTDEPNEAPDMPDDTDAPPDMPEDAGMDNSGFGTDDQFSDVNDSTNDNKDNSNLGLDEKISSIMNMNLYQQYLALLNNITSEINMIKTNSDILSSINPESMNIIETLRKLDDNIRIYIKNNYINENYSKNLLFFNKCLNLLKLINDSFDKSINHLKESQ